MKKHMVKLMLISGSLLFFSLPSFSQASFGVKAGVTFTSLQLTYKNGDKATGATVIPGFNAGVTAEFPVWQNIYVQPGLMYTTKGGKLTGDADYWFWGDETDDGDYLKLNARYIELPLNVIYKYPLGKGKAIGGLGPYVAYGIGGSWRDNYKGDITKGKLTFDKRFSNIPGDGEPFVYGKKLDIGINVLLGYELTNHLSATINGSFGLRNLTPLASDENATDAKEKNIGGSISIGYRF